MEKIQLKEDKDILNNLNFRGLFLVKNFRISSEMIKLISKKESAFLIDFSQLYGLYGVKRAILLSQMRDFFRFCIKYGAKYCIEAGDRSEREIIGIGSLVGVKEGQVKFARKELENYL